MSSTSVGSTAPIPQQLTHINTDKLFVKVWGIMKKDKLDFVRDMIEVYTPKLAEGYGKLRNLTELIPGKVVLALYNNVFQRARVLRLDSGRKKKVIVNFIDLGVVTSVDVSDVRIKDSILSSLLVGSVPQTGLAEDFILNGVIARKQWSNQEIESINLDLRHCTELGLSGIVGDKKIIQVIITINGQRIDLSTFLIEEGLCDHISEDSFTDLLRFNFGKMSVPVANPFTTSPPSIPDVQVPSSSAIPRQSKIRSTNVAPVYSTDKSHTSLPPAYKSVRDTVTTIQSYVYPTLPINTTHDVIVSHVIDGMNAFAVQLKKSADFDLPKLMTRINEIWPIPIIKPIGPGDLCIGRCIQNERLCRAVVTDVLADGANLNFVDIGNTEIVPFDEIYRIPPKFVQEPVMALQFALADLPISLSSDEASTIFTKMVLQQDVAFKLRVVESVVSTQQRCELFYIAKGKPINIKARIINRIKLMKPVEYKKITLKKNQVADVIVTYSESFLKFFVQFDLNQPVLEMLMKCVEEYCSNSENNGIVFMEDFVENMAVCAPYEDGKYYRGLILDGEPDNEGNLTVFYVDYGNHDTVHYSKIRIMNNEMISQFPMQATECRLDIDSSLIENPGVTDSFIALVDGKNFKMSVKNILSGNVLLVDLVDKHGSSIASYLTKSFGVKSTSAGDAVSSRAPLLQSSSSDWKVVKRDLNSNHLQSRFDDRGRGSHFKPTCNDSDSANSIEGPSNEKSSDSGSKSDNEESRRRGEFYDYRSEDIYSGFRDRKDTRGSYDNDNDTRNSRKTQNDNKIGFGGRRFNHTSRDRKNKPSDGDFDGRSPSRNKFDAESPRKNNRSKDSGFNDRLLQRGNHFDDEEESSSRFLRRRARSSRNRRRQNVDPSDSRGNIRLMTPVPL